jgi:hypothetical protein
LENLNLGTRHGQINYQKSEVFVVGSSEEANRTTNLFNCNIGKQLLKYLGVMLNNRYMTGDDLTYVAQKVEKRVPTWQSVGLSWGVILIESCLSSFPNYTMEIYLLQEEVHHKMDTTRSNFFWHGPHLKRRYHMAKWELMATPKSKGEGGWFYQY